MISLTRLQARQFILLKHGLIDKYKFIGKVGVLDFIKQAGCIQFDPVDICGRNADLTLQSRIKDYTKSMLDYLLYDERKIYDNYDKCLSIISIEDWPYFGRYRESAKIRGLSGELLDSLEHLEMLKNKTIDYVYEKGPICSGDLVLEGRLCYSGGYNGTTNVTKIVLDYLCSTGDMIIHHKNGTRKYYDLAKKHISDALLNAFDPLPNEFDHLKWRVMRRIGAIGLLWNRSSDAWLYIKNLWKDSKSTKKRKEVFQALLNEEKIIEIQVDNIKDIFYCHSEDMSLIEAVLQNPVLEPRCEFIAPLDPFIWDRKLIKLLFDFDYKWEIYTPDSKRQYGAYVLPILYGEKFIGRIEMLCDRKNKDLIIKNIWYENNTTLDENIITMIDKCIRRFAEFNGCIKISKDS